MSDRAIQKITIRMAGREDAAAILGLIRELASYEDLLDQVRASEADILRDGFGDRPRFECLLAEQGGAAVGFALFYLKGVAPPEIQVGTIYRGVVPFIVLQLIGLAIIFVYTGIVTWLPGVAYG